MIFVNKLDRERAIFQRTLDELRSTVRRRHRAARAPDRRRDGLPRRRRSAHRQGFHLRGRHAHRGRDPRRARGARARGHDNLVEGIVVADDELLERFLDGDMPSPAELEHTLAVGVAAASVFPVVCGSASDARRRSTGSPTSSARSARRPPTGPASRSRAGTTTQEIAPDPDGQPLAFVFKTIADPYVGQLSLFKVLSGTVKPDDHLVTRAPAPTSGCTRSSRCGARTKTRVTSVPAGDLAAVSKLSATATGDTLAPKGTPVHVATIAPPPPCWPSRSRRARKPTTTSSGRPCNDCRRKTRRSCFQRSDETKQTLLSGYRRDPSHDGADDRSRSGACDGARHTTLAQTQRRRLDGCGYGIVSASSALPKPIACCKTSLHGSRRVAIWW